MSAAKISSGTSLAAFFAVVAAAVYTPSELAAKNMQPTEIQRQQAIAEGYDENILTDYWPYFEYAKKAGGGSCCGFKDAMVVDPADVEKTDDPENPYRVLIRRTSSGLVLEKPYWITVSASILIDQTQSAKICETYNDAAEAQNIDAFCSVPPFDVMFFNDGSRYDPATGNHYVAESYEEMTDMPSYKLYPAGHILKHDEMPSFGPTKYCFQPAPQGF